MKKFIRKVTKSIIYLCFLISSVTLILELSYRFYAYDFYANTFKALNSEADLKNKDQKQTILVLGDSFTADPNSYVQHLRDSLPEYCIINSGIPGTSITQASLMLKKRIAQTNPSKIIYQIYVGNDIFDIKHPYKGKSLSLIRKTYWWLRDRIYFVGYVNSRLPSIRQALSSDIPEIIDPKINSTYSPSLYSKRSRLHFDIEPQHLENTILVKNQRKKDVEKYISKLESFIQQIPNTISLEIAVVPHCIQVNRKYFNRMSQLGAIVEDEEGIFKTRYDFYNRLEFLIRKFDHVNIINTLASIKEGEINEPMYYENDPHLNPKGQEVLSRSIVKNLK